ncbi:UNVERIFIED_CONTAM: Retrovirus-related Pol polyprotein from type-2 retrotransposable element R2DM [Sesamum radiatum]|uniref:Retrovirus-related Pol polyprotein from type-2 retrotransposable element R2DM n=1 Tax=Sesamum radiatum TaxID=300843 RepID=A0AAW2IHT1_SESRA
MVLKCLVCVNKLKSLKPIFRAQRKVKGDLSKNVQQAKVFLDKAQVLFDVYKEGLLLQLVKMCQVLYCVSVKQERSMLQQRAKLNWLKDGDQCTKVFFRKINTRRARQHIHQIMDSTGELKSEPSQVVSEFVSYYQTLLGGVRNNRALDLSFLQPGLKHILTMEEANGLVSAVSLDEIKEAFFDISEDSAPGPDGYTSAFFKAAWPIIGRDVGAAVMEFFQSGRILKQVNATLLVLIPKVPLPARVSDFRPIACCNVIYKAITKLLVRRMQQVLPLLIDCSQNAFIPGRSIADNVMLAQELLSGYNLKRLPPRCTIKVDIQKAYDSVSWDFVLEGLRIFNFPSSFIGWIEQCITTVTYSVSLNGSIHGFFQGARGIRQGDPMSPYLFVIVMEYGTFCLSCAFRILTDFLYHWKCRELGILNLCFADDVLIFCSADTQSASIIKQSLAEFAILSGLQVNPHKSQVILSKSVQSERQAILDIMGYQAGMLPIKYLGVPLVASRLSIEDCKPLLHKIDKRLAGWGQLTLSFAGRTQLIKSVLSSLHMYWASVFILPKSITNAIESRLRTFLWQGATGKGVAKVAWRKYANQRRKGGLGLEGLRNQSIWTYHSSNSSWCWKKLIKLSSLMRPGLDYQVGDGQQFMVWTDIWHPQGPLLRSFPRGPSITGLPADSLLRTVMLHGTWNWPSECDFDIQDIISSLPIIHPNQPDTKMENSDWKLHYSGSVCYAPASVPPALLERLTTMDRIWMEQQDTGCVLCGGLLLESHEHLFFHCPYAEHCINILKSVARFQWPGLGWKRDIIWASKRWRGKHLLNAAARTLLASLVYNLWMERNRRRFTSTAASADLIAMRAIEDVRYRIISESIRPSLQRFNLYRIWKIPWDRA